METQQHEEVRTTTSYWGYRELSADEIYEVGGGGDFSGTGFGSNTGYGASSYTSSNSSSGNPVTGALRSFTQWLNDLGLAPTSPVRSSYGLRSAYDSFDGAG